MTVLVRVTAVYVTLQYATSAAVMKEAVRSAGSLVELYRTD
jgi:hypothetical protein